MNEVFYRHHIQAHAVTIICAHLLCLVQCHSRKIPLQYLPKTRPHMPLLVELPPLSSDMTSERVKTVRLSPIWPSTCQAQSLTSQGTELPSIHVSQAPLFSQVNGYLNRVLGFPTSTVLFCLWRADPNRFEDQLSNVPSCDETVHIRLRSTASQKTKSLHRSERAARPSGEYSGNCCCRPEELPEPQRLLHDPEAGRGTRRTGILVGCQGYHRGSGMLGFILKTPVVLIVSPQYFIRFIVRPPRDTPHLPLFRHEELVQLTTDPYESLETELLTGNLRAPALGLSTLRAGPACIMPPRPLRPLDC